MASGLHTGQAIARVPAAPPKPVPALAHRRAFLEWPGGTKVATMRAMSVSAEKYSAGLMRQALAASTDRPAVLMQFLGGLSAE
jgi:hypothetical protein